MRAGKGEAGLLNPIVMAQGVNNHVFEMRCVPVLLKLWGWFSLFAGKQVDGEPWKQPPSEITVKLHNQVSVARKPTDAGSAQATTVFGV